MKKTLLWIIASLKNIVIMTVPSTAPIMEDFTSGMNWCCLIRLRPARDFVHRDGIFHQRMTGIFYLQRISIAGFPEVRWSIPASQASMHFSPAHVIWTKAGISLVLQRSSGRQHQEAIPNPGHMGWMMLIRVCLLIRLRGLMPSQLDAWKINARQRRAVTRHALQTRASWVFFYCELCDYCGESFL